MRSQKKCAAKQKCLELLQQNQKNVKPKIQKYHTNKIVIRCLSNQNKTFPEINSLEIERRYSKKKKVIMHVVFHFSSPIFCFLLFFTLCHFPLFCVCFLVVLFCTYFPRIFSLLLFPFFALHGFYFFFFLVLPNLS